MFFEHGKPTGPSLRIRVAAWIAGTVLATSVLILAMVREGVRQALLHELDATLQADADEILLERDQHLGEPSRVQETMRNQARAHPDGIWYAQLSAADGSEIFSTATTPMELRHDRLPLGKPESVDGYRVLQIKSSDGQSVLRVGMLLGVIDSDMVRIDRLVGLVALGFLVIAPLAGFAVATVVLKPITEMSKRTAQLHPSRLDTRLPLSGAGQELDHLATVINNLLGRIAQYVGEHRGLMADAAHQLRTPLAAIRSSVEVILAAGENTPENLDLLSQVLEQLESLETLVSQLLLLAETEVENLELGTEQVHFDDLVRRSLEMFEAVAETLGVELDVARIDAAVVRGNRHYLRQIVNNLLDNAIKFTAIKQGVRRVAVQLSRDDQHGIVQLQVADSGIGIEAKHLSLIFGRFYRVDPARRNELGMRGNGLGLSIVKSVVESHGGEVEAKSVEGQGTTLTVKLPLSSA